MHEYIFDDLLYPGWVKTFCKLLDSILARGDIWVASPGEVAEYWYQRYRQIVQASLGLELGRSTDQRVCLPFDESMFVHNSELV